MAKNTNADHQRGVIIIDLGTGTSESDDDDVVFGGNTTSSGFIDPEEDKETPREERRRRESMFPAPTLQIVPIERKV